MDGEKREAGINAEALQCGKHLTGCPGCKPLQPARVKGGKLLQWLTQKPTLISNSCGERVFNSCIAPCTFWALINIKWW